MNLISIGNRKVGEGQPCYIIAEAGVNHNGDPELARKLIDAAADAGADAVKFQTFKAEKLVTASAKMADYQVRNLNAESSQLEMLQKLELKYEAHKALKEYTESRGLDFLSTPFHLDAIDFLAELGLKAFKVGSGEITNAPYLRKMAAIGLPVILSSGMSTLAEVEAAVALVREAGNEQIAVLHCVSNYPCPPDYVNLRAMDTMAAAIPYVIGYSDHTDGILASVAAVARGAAIIEKHFTLDRSMPGPDHQASLEPADLKEMCAQIRAVEVMLGTGEKVPVPSEMPVREKVRKSIVAAHPLQAGQLIQPADLDCKRPADGISPMEIDQLIGKKLLKDIEADAPLRWEDLA